MTIRLGCRWTVEPRLEGRRRERGRRRTGLVEKVDLDESGCEENEKDRIGDPVFESGRVVSRGRAGGE